MKKETWFLIPAREGSKGLPHKNRKLFFLTVQKLPPSLKNRVIVSTDDPYIIAESDKLGLKVHFRGKEQSSDEASILSVVKQVVLDTGINDSRIVLLYLTYPERTYEDIEKAINFFEKNSADSLLCKKKVKVHPYLCFLERGEKHGSPLISHPYYRRQDYPKCFELSHFISIFNTKEIENLNSQLYNERTVFFPIDDPIDVDEPEDLTRYENKHNR